MKEYPKIQSVFHRDVEGEKRLLPGRWSRPEFEILRDIKWDVTEKIDGTNIQVEWDGSEVKVGGRTKAASIPAAIVNILLSRFPSSFFEGLPQMVIFGEGYGSGIQSAGKEYLKDSNEFIIFDIWSVKGGYWWPLDEVMGFTTSRGLPVVPCYFGHYTLDEAIAATKRGFTTALQGSARAEGLVLRAPFGMCDYKGERVIVKLKTKDKYA